jgi:hypothetical protein
MFRIASADLNGIIDSGTIETLSPGPTFVEYPESFDNNPVVSQDGNVVVQAPIKDSRPRHWVWQNYKFDIPRYDALYVKLYNLQTKLRVGASPAKSEWVFLYEDVTDELSTRAWGGTEWTKSPAWVRVKVFNVTRQIRRSGGKVTYDDTRLSFIIDDATWNAF